MKLPHPITLCALALTTVLSLSACTTEDPAPIESNRNITVRLAAGNTPAQQALAHVYANSLEKLGYTVTLSEAKTSPVEQLSAAEVDVALGLAPDATALLDAGADPRGEDLVLSLDEAKALSAQLNDAQLGFTALDLSAADAGQVLVLSGASAIERSIDSVDSLAAACTGLQIYTDDAQSRNLNLSLQAAGCAKPQITRVATDKLAGALRESQDHVVVLSAADAIIGDEGFAVIPGSNQLFDSAPVLPLVDESVPDDAIAAIQNVTKALNQAALVSLNRMVSGPDALDPQIAAGRWKQITDQ